MSDAEQSEEQTIGERVDAAVEAVRVELNARIDEVQAAVAELSAKIDERQAAGPTPETPPAE